MLKRIALYTFLLFAMTILANAQPGGGSGEMTPSTNSGIKLDQSPLIEAIDTDKDGKVSLDEWTAIGGPEGIFNFTDADGDGYTTLSEMNETTPPDMADANGDGKLTLEEFKAWRAADEASPGGAPPEGGPPPEGGGPPQAPPQ